MSEVQACLFILGINAFILVLSVGVLGVVVKLYTEALKELRHHSREMQASKRGEEPA